MQQARSYLDTVVQRLSGSAVRAEPRLVVSPESAQTAVAILDAAQAERADLIAMATHGRTGVGRLLLGSVADKVLRGSERPLLVWRPPERSAQEA